MLGVRFAGCLRALLLFMACGFSAVTWAAPTVVNDFVTVTNTASGINVTASPLLNDSGVGTLTLLSAQPTSAVELTFFDPSSGTFGVYIGAGFSGTVIVNYDVSDSADSITGSGIVTITVNAPTPLQAVDDTFSAPHNDGSNPTPVELNVLANDTGVDPQQSPVVSLTGGLTPAGAGTLTPSSLGNSFDFTPGLGFSGTATFTYSIQQGSEISSATATITVGAAAGGALIDNGLLTPEQQQAAQVVDNACANASGALAATCAEIGTLSPEQQQQVIGQIQPNQVPAQATASMLQQNEQLANLRGRLQALRSGARGVNFSGLNLQLFDKSVALGSLVERELVDSADRSGSAGEASPFADSPWGLFVTGRINLGDVEGSKGREDFDFKTLGLTGGVDYRLDDKLVLGGALGFGTSANDFGSTRGKVDVDSWSLSFYGNYYPTEQLYFDWVLGYGRNDYDGHRRLQFADIDTRAKYATDGSQYSGSATVGYEWTKQAWQFGTYVRLDYIHTQIDAYRESGGAGLALAINEQQARSLESALGGRLARAFSLSNGVLIPGLELEWIHQWNDDSRSISASFVDAPDSGRFNISADGMDEDYLKAGVSLTGVFTGGKAGFLRYQTSLGRDRIDEHTIEAGFRMEF